jgi:cell division septation protein DedD
MRIDYSEPKKSYTAPHTGQNRTKNESSGSLVPIVIITCIISLGLGFGSGWTLSQRSAKKGFKAAMEQQSLENSPRRATAQPSPSKPEIIAPPGPDALQQPLPGGAQAAPAAPGTGTQTIPDQQLSFYKNLPSGQKNNVLGSGINTRDDKPAKQVLQAAIPTNLTRPSPSQNAAENTKPAISAAPEKPGVRQDGNAFAVQVASLSLRSEAEALKNKLAGKGYNAYIAESNQGNKGTWYRVRVGRGLEQDAAKELAGKLGKGAMAIPEKD